MYRVLSGNFVILTLQELIKIKINYYDSTKFSN